MRMRPERLEEALRGAASHVRAPGAVATVFDRRGVAVASSGRTTVGPDARAVLATDWFEVGSVTKAMTATLVLQLVAEGRVGLDDPVVAHLPSFRLASRSATEAVTVRHLLTHTSGIDIADDFTATGDGYDCLERYVDDVVGGAELIDPVGLRWSYSNGGYVVLGRVIEAVSGASWDDAVRERIFEPAGMAATTIRRDDWGGRLVPGHRLDYGGALVVDRRKMPSSVGPAGNVIADVESLGRFATALLVERTLVEPGLVDEMISPQVTMRTGHYGFGWTIPVPGVVAHGGASIGHTAFLGCIPAAGGVLAVLANGPGAGIIAGLVQQELFGGSAEVDDSDRPIDPSVPLEAMAGSYRRRHVQVAVDLVADGLVATVRRSGAAAELFGDEPAVRLRPVGGTRFTSVRPDGGGTDTWDFIDIDDRGIPTSLLTERVHRRVG